MRHRGKRRGESQKNRQSGAGRWRGALVFIVLSVIIVTIFPLSDYLVGQRWWGVVLLLGIVGLDQVLESSIQTQAAG